MTATTSYQGKQRAKLETFTGEICNKVNYYPATEGKKSYAKFDFFSDKKGALAHLRFIAFDDIADSLSTYSHSAKMIIGATKNSKDDGTYIVQHFRIVNEQVSVTQRTKLTDVEVAKLNKEYQKEGYALVSINVNDREQYVKKQIADTLVVAGKRFDKLEYIMDVLGAEYVTKRLKEALGKDLKLTKEYSSLYRKLKNELLREALDKDSQ